MKENRKKNQDQIFSKEHADYNSKVQTNPYVGDPALIQERANILDNALLAQNKLLLVLEGHQLLHILSLKVASKAILVALVGREEIQETVAHASLVQVESELVNRLIDQVSLENSGDELERETCS